MSATSNATVATVAQSAEADRDNNSLNHVGDNKAGAFEFEAQFNRALSETSEGNRKLGSGQTRMAAIAMAVYHNTHKGSDNATRMEYLSSNAGDQFDKQERASLINKIRMAVKFMGYDRTETDRHKLAVCKNETASVDKMIGRGVDMACDIAAAYSDKNVTAAYLLTFFDEVTGTFSVDPSALLEETYRWTAASEVWIEKNVTPDSDGVRKVALDGSWFAVIGGTKNEAKDISATIAQLRIAGVSRRKNADGTQAETVVQRQRQPATPTPTAAPVLSAPVSDLPPAPASKASRGRPAGTTDTPVSEDIKVTMHRLTVDVTAVLEVMSEDTDMSSTIADLASDPLVNEITALHDKLGQYLALVTAARASKPNSKPVRKSRGH